MARPLRIEFPGALYHVINRGNARNAIYHSDCDRRDFFHILHHVVKRYRWRCHAYCLMGNHYHLLIETPEANLSKGMRQMNGVYTQSFNRRYRRVGHLFQGRYKAILVERDPYLLEVARYIVLNPVRAKLAEAAAHYPWSSYRSTAGLRQPEPFLTTAWILGQFAGESRRAQHCYRTFVRQGIKGEAAAVAIKGRVILGSESFTQAYGLRNDAGASLAEVPKAQRFAGRPALAVIFTNGTASKPARNHLIRVACLEYGYSLAEVARYLGLHYSTY